MTTTTQGILLNIALGDIKTSLDANNLGGAHIAASRAHVLLEIFIRILEDEETNEISSDDASKAALNAILARHQELLKAWEQFANKNLKLSSLDIDGLLEYNELLKKGNEICDSSTLKGANACNG